MVFTHVLDSVIVSSSHAGRPTEEIKRTGPQLSLKDLVSPFGLRKARFTDVHATRDSSSLRCHQANTFTSSSTTSTSPVIVGPEHNFVRRRVCQYSKESFSAHVPKPDVTATGLPNPGTKFWQFSDSRPHAFRGTPVANESHHRDSSSEIQTAPFSQEPLSRLPNQEVITKRQTTSTTSTGIYSHSQHHQTPTALSQSTMSSPKCYKQMSRRSRSIAIKSPQAFGHVLQSDTIAAEEDSASTERMYDWATWRMYNRIVDHRRNQRLSSPSLPQPEPSTTSNAMIMPHTTLDDFDDGEVFEMEI